MGIVTPLFETIEKHVKRGRRVLSLGYPDILVPEARWPSDVILRKDSAAIAAIHNQPGLLVPEAGSLFEYWGCKLDVCDIAEIRGGEIVLDLNVPQPQLELQYDLVLDPGTLEHCMNFGQALSNASNAVKIGGVQISWNPCVMPNHGFFQISPTLYHDWYAANGFDILSMDLVAWNEDRWEIIEAPRIERFDVPPDLAIHLMTVARRGRLVEFTFPMQSRFRETPA